MQYGKLTEGNLEIFNGNKVRVNNRVYINPQIHPDEPLLLLGYKPIVDAEPPEYNAETQYLEPTYTDGDEVITRSWTVKDIESEVD